VTPQAQPVSTELVARRAGVYLQPTTMQIIELTARDGKLRIGRDGPELVPVAENRFRLANNSLEIVFGAGEHSGFERRPVSGGRAMPFEWKAAVVPTHALLSNYAGRYASEELGGAVYTVTAGDSTIALRTGTESPREARLVYADAFLMDGTTIQFTRTKGAITGFEVTDGRVRRVKFARR